MKHVKSVDEIFAQTGGGTCEKYPFVCGALKAKIEILMQFKDYCSGDYNRLSSLIDDTFGDLMTES